MGTIEFKQLRRTQVRDAINRGRPRNQQGGLNWSREDYVAYALARPVDSKLLAALGITGDVWRTIRFRRHEGIANDNLNHYAVAYILWMTHLVSVDGVERDDAVPYPPHALVDYVTSVAPWLPRPPNDKQAAA